MTAIRIETQLDSDTLYLQQLKPLLGKAVEIIVREKAIPVVTPGSSDWADVRAAVLDLENYDFDAVHESRQAEVRRAEQDRP